MQTDYNNWAPRLGISYTPTQHWVVRAGYGMFTTMTSPMPASMWRVTWPVVSRILRAVGLPGVATINWSNAVGPTGAGSALATIPPPYSYSNAVRSQDHIQRGLSARRSEAVRQGLAVRGRIPGQRQQSPLRVPQCQLFSSVWFPWQRGVDFHRLAVRPTRTMA